MLSIEYLTDQNGQTNWRNRFTLKVQYRKRFLKDLKALKNQPVYEQILQPIATEYALVNID